MSSFGNAVDGQPGHPVKYAAYRPKRHSRNGSLTPNTMSPKTNLTPNWNANSTNSNLNVPHDWINGTKLESSMPNGNNSIKEPSSPPPSPPAPPLSQASIVSPTPAVPASPSSSPLAVSSSSASPSSLVPAASSPSVSTASSSTLPASSALTSSSASPAPTSTFRRIRPHGSSPLARSNSMLVPNQSPSSRPPRPSSMLVPSQPGSGTSRPSSMLIPKSDTITSAPTSPTRAAAAPSPPSSFVNLPVSVASPPPTKPEPVSPPSIISPPSRSTTSTPTPSAVVSSSPTPISTPTSSKQSKQAPYRPGFQPRGVIGLRTDEFLAARKLARNGPEDGSQKRVERTKLERRLEKIIALHFPEPDLTNGKEREGDKEKEKEKEKKSSLNGTPIRPSLLGTSDARRRTSSFFENIDIRRMSSSFLGTGGETESIRSAEQRITPWQPDSAVSRCPHCDASFHPLSNRKHHCRLCGRVVCALGVKKPQRPEPCSILFVIDPKTRQIEQVEEGVDYGVRKRTASMDMRSLNGNGKPIQDSDDGDEDSQKFLKGVRVCRECKPVLLRQQYLRERTNAVNGNSGPAGEFLRLYDAFLVLEKEIEDSLPQFDELITSLSSSNANSNEALSSLTTTAAAERKRLLQSFATYDALVKKIRSLPYDSNDPKGKTGTGGGHSQERVQAAIALRGARFLEARMVGLGAVPAQGKKGEHQHKKSGSKSKSGTAPPLGDAIEGQGLSSSESAVHAALQPLLEQESLLESYVAEATAARKFEDAKTLRGNLKEIRGEIERLVKDAGR